ncbi:hypothetical protein FIU87_13375 [Bacillus sp. THAF10]|uniref:hypothetical protein n=1 Tax=Bacillus sp. THAF10 TaxID=2587848 RepID=UPI001267BA26|nr:hypothetical protein [Bacillus sp. THAF10]QFT89646.1 hypothetical protein FIU87_13375 [Bacillus sp. THAF10]
MKFSFSVLVLFLLILTACTSTKVVTEWETEVMNMLITIAYVGERPNIDKDGVTFVPYLKSENYESIWISDSKFEEYSSKEALVNMNENLNQGKVIVYLTEENAYETIAPAFGITGYEELKEGDSIQHGFYLWKQNGEVRIGFVLGEKGSKAWKVFLEHTITNSRNL